MDITIKWCPECSKHKAVSEFARDYSRSIGYGTYCKPCRREKFKENPVRQRIYYLKKRYKLTQKQWDAMFEAQERCCAICKCKKAIWHTDHDPITRVVRGILCSKCNQGIGLLQHDTEILEAAIQYLKK